MSGKVSAVSGSGPSLRFRVGGRDVATDAATDYKRGKCRDLSDGDSVKVSGVIQLSGVAIATNVEFNR